MILILKSEEIDITSEEMFLWGKAMNLDVKIMTGKVSPSYKTTN